MRATEPRGSTMRYPALDGLRGLAALVVVVHHSLLAIPALAMAYAQGGRASGLAWWVSYTPLHILWSGPEAVYIFFVLSGFVLALPATRGSMQWTPYYAKRFVRLYLPVWGALVFAAVLVTVVSRHDVGGASWWLNGRSGRIPLREWLHDGIDVNSTTANTVLWSLHFEILFSALLPLYIAFGALWRRLWPLKLALCLVMVAVGSLHGPAPLMYLPMFAIGAVLAFERESILTALRRWAVIVPALYPMLALLAVVLMTSTWTVAAAGAPGGKVRSVLVAAELLGATLVVVLALVWPKGEVLLDRPVMQWLGARSFSLYLVHEPIVVSAAIILGPHWAGATTFIAVPVSLAAAEVFYRIVERPTIRLCGAIAGQVNNWHVRTASPA